MPINIQTGPTAGLAGAVGFAAGKRQYDDEQKAIERQLRQQELQNNLRGIQGLGQALQPFVNNAIQKQTRQWQDEADMKKTQAIMAEKRKPENIAAAAKAAEAAQVEAIKAAQGIKTKGYEYLKSIGPAAAGFATRQSGERVAIGGGSGMLDEKQFLAALNQVDERAQRFGKGVGSGMTNQEVLAQRLVTDPGTGNQFLVTGSKSNPTITPVNNSSGDRKLKMREAAATHVRTMSASFEKQYQSDLSRLTGQWMDSGDTPEQMIDKAKAFREVMDSQRPGSENNPWDKWITDALATEAGPAAGVGGLGAASAGPLERAQRGLQGGGPPMDLGGLGGGGVPAGGVPAGGVPAGGVPAGGVPAGGVPAGGVPPAGGGEGQLSGAELDEVIRQSGGGPPSLADSVGMATQKADEWRTELLPSSAEFWDDKRQDSRIRELSKQEFYTQGSLDREYGFLGPKFKGPVAEQDWASTLTGGLLGESEKFSYSHKSLKHALTAIRSINDTEMRMGQDNAGNWQSLWVSGEEGRNLHRVRDAAQQWIHQVEAQLQESQKRWEMYGGASGTGDPKRAGPKKGPKWLYSGGQGRAGEPIPMPELLENWDIGGGGAFFRGQRAPGFVEPRGPLEGLIDYFH